MNTENVSSYVPSSLNLSFPSKQDGPRTHSRLMRGQESASAGAHPPAPSWGGMGLAERLLFFLSNLFILESFELTEKLQRQSGEFQYTVDLVSPNANLTKSW